MQPTKETAMNQQINLFNSLLFTEWATLATLGICLLALQKHKKPAYPIYTRARYLLAIDFLLFSLDPFLYWLTEEGICRIPQLGVIGLGLYLVVAVLLSMTYIPFVQPDYITRKKVFLNILLLAGSLSALFSGAVTGGVFSLASRIAVTAVLLVTVCLFGIRFYSYYQKAQQKMDNFYADNFKQSITRLSSSVTLIVILGISSCSAPFFPHWGIAIHKTLCFLSAIYVFLSFINYMFNVDFVALAVGLPQENGRLSKSTIEKLQRHTRRWQETPGALTKNITINDVSRQLGTNRAYLSLYLNTYLDTTFTEWIGRIRLRKAKSLLASDAIMTMEQIAEAAGFTSASAFSHYFKAHEGLSPKLWRRQNRHRKTTQAEGKEDTE